MKITPLLRRPNFAWENGFLLQPQTFEVKPATEERSDEGYRQAKRKRRLPGRPVDRGVMPLAFRTFS